MWVPLAATAISAGVSALSNRGQRNIGPTNAMKRREEMIGQLSGELDQPLTGQAAFQSGVGQLSEQLQRQQLQDQGQQGQFGGGGTEMAIAQSANRSRAAASGVTNLVGVADNAQRGNRQQMISMLAGQDQAENQLRAFDEQRRNQRGQMLGNALGNFAQMYAAQQ